MSDYLQVTVRKNRTTHVVAISGTLGITCFIAYFVSIFSSGKSPLEESETYLLLFGFLFTALAFYVHFGGGVPLSIEKNESGYTTLLIRKGKMIAFEYTAQLKTRAVVMQVPTGGRGAISTMPEIYLVFSDPSDKPVLTLKYNPGKLATISSEFERVQLGALVATNIYTCNKIPEVLAFMKSQA